MAFANYPARPDENDEAGPAFSSAARNAFFAAWPRQEQPASLELPQAVATLEGPKPNAKAVPSPSKAESVLMQMYLACRRFLGSVAAGRTGCADLRADFIVLDWNSPFPFRESNVTGSGLRSPLRTFGWAIRCLPIVPMAKKTWRLERRLIPQPGGNYVACREEGWQLGRHRVVAARLVARVRKATVGGTVEIAVPECGINGKAEGLVIGPCPRSSQAKCIVTGVFRHSSAQIVDLFVEGQADPSAQPPTIASGPTCGRSSLEPMHSVLASSCSPLTGTHVSCAFVPRDGVVNPFTTWKCKAHTYITCPSMEFWFTILYWKWDGWSSRSMYYKMSLASISTAQITSDT